MDLLSLNGDRRFQDLLKVLAIDMEYSNDPLQSPSVISRPASYLSVFEYQKLCTILAGYRFSELLVLREGLGSRVSASTPILDMYLPPSTSAINQRPYVNKLCLYIVIIL